MDLGFALRAERKCYYYYNGYVESVLGVVSAFTWVEEYMKVPFQAVWPAHYLVLPGMMEGKGVIRVLR